MTRDIIFPKQGCLFIQLDSTVEFTGNKGSAKKDHQG